MADSVHFLTTENTVDATKSSGCNGFCAPFLYDITGIEEFFPIAMTQQEAKTLQSRVRRLACVTDLIVTADTVSCVVDSARLLGGTIKAGSLEATTEWDSRRQGDDGPGIFCVFTRTVVPGITTFATGLNIFIGGGQPCPVIYRDGDDFYPWFEVGFSITVEDSGSGSRIHLEISTRASAIASPDGSITGHFMGKNFTLYYKKTVDINGPNSFVFTQLDIDPDTAANSYWPHAASDASPIFNHATGAQLQNENN